MTAISLSCYLAMNGEIENGKPMPSCHGPLIRAHLIPKQRIRKVSGADVWDRRSWVWACGGDQGCSGHHGMFDTSKRLRLPADRLPPGVIEFAAEHGLTWSLARDYGFDG